MREECRTKTPELPRDPVGQPYAIPSSRLQQPRPRNAGDLPMKLPGGKATERRELAQRDEAAPARVEADGARRLGHVLELLTEQPFYVVADGLRRERGERVERRVQNQDA